MIKHFVVAQTYYDGFGWGSGYIVLPKNHPCYGLPYDLINEKYNILVHGGLTFSGPNNSQCPFKLDENVWVVGFDTFHYHSKKLFKTEQDVLEETLKLKKQFKNTLLSTKVKKILKL